MIERSHLKGVDLIGSDWQGQTSFLRTTDTSNLEPVKMPYSDFKIWLSRFILSFLKLW